MTAKRKPKPTQPVLRPPTSKELEAIAHASSRLSQRRKRVQAKVEVADGVSKISHTHSDGRGWAEQLTDAFGTSSQAFASLLITQA
jgi:hypothetical protein